MQSASRNRIFHEIVTFDLFGAKIKNPLELNKKTIYISVQWLDTGRGRIPVCHFNFLVHSSVLRNILVSFCFDECHEKCSQGVAGDSVAAC